MGRHWLVLAIATWRPAAYADLPQELDAAHQAARPPRRHSLLQQGVTLRRGLLRRGYLWACVWLRPTPGPDVTSRAGLRRVDPGGP